MKKKIIKFKNGSTVNLKEVKPSERLKGVSKDEPTFITCSECGMSFVANHECDQEVLRNRAEEEQRSKEESSKRFYNIFGDN